MKRFLIAVLWVTLAAVRASPNPAKASIEAKANLDIEAEVSISADSSIYDGPIEWDDNCDCNLEDNDYYDDILYMRRRYQDFAAVRDFENYVKREVDTWRRDFFSAGAENQTTLFENEQAFQRLRLRPRILRGVGVRDTTTQLLGDDASFPLGIAPIALLEYADPDGENGVAEAAECEGVPYIVSAFSNTDLEEIAARAPHANLWMETFIFFDRSITQSIIERAEASGYRAIVVTVPLPESGNIVPVARNNPVLPDYIHLPNIENDESNENLATEDSVHRHHILSQIELVKGKGYFKTEKVDQRYERTSQCIGSFGLADYFNYLVDPEQSWDDIRWIRKTTNLPIVVRGVLTGCDAIRAVENGANAIIVDNLGGRGLDSAPAAIEALAEVLEAVDVYQNVEVYLSGGVRWGTDILKALAIGADGVFIGRPVSWGMLHSGKCGVRRVLQVLRREFERDMGLMGVKHVDEITSTMVVTENYYRHRYRPNDVDGRTSAREDRLECPFGYDYDENFDPSLEDVIELRPRYGPRLPNNYGISPPILPNF
ncbi:Hydroxyacid oxidase 1, partial [Stegodyphus mimosarum]